MCGYVVNADLISQQTQIIRSKIVVFVLLSIYMTFYYFFQRASFHLCELEQFSFASVNGSYGRKKKREARSGSVNYKEKTRK